MDGALIAVATLLFAGWLVWALMRGVHVARHSGAEELWRRHLVTAGFVYDGARWERRLGTIRAEARLTSRVVYDSALLHDEDDPGRRVALPYCELTLTLRGTCPPITVIPFGQTSWWPRVSTGDARFDQRFSAHGESEPATLALLTAAVRDRIASSLETHGGARLVYGAVECHWEGGYGFDFKAFVDQQLELVWALDEAASVDVETALYQGCVDDPDPEVRRRLAGALMAGDYPRAAALADHTDPAVRLRHGAWRHSRAREADRPTVAREVERLALEQLVSEDVGVLQVALEVLAIVGSPDGLAVLEDHVRRLGRIRSLRSTLAATIDALRGREAVELGHLSLEGGQGAGVLSIIEGDQETLGDESGSEPDVGVEADRPPSIEP